jgi:hypothetical protein
MTRFFLIIMVLVAIPAGCQAYTLDEIIDALAGGNVVYELDDIVYAPAAFRPDNAPTCQGHVCYWGDILGYRNMVRVGDTFYISGLPEDSIIVMSGATHDIKGPEWLDYTVDKLETSIASINTTDRVTTVTFKVYLQYHHSQLVCIGEKCHVRKTYYEEEYYFTDTDCNTPLQYPSQGTYNASVRFYNNSIKPKTLIALDLAGLDTKVEYRYFDEKVTFRSHVYTVETSDKGVPYGNLTAWARWDPVARGQSILYYYNAAWIPGNGFDPAGLNVNVSNPYNSTSAALNIIEYGDIKPDFPVFSIISVLLPVFFIAAVTVKITRYYRR